MDDRIEDAVERIEKKIDRLTKLCLLLNQKGDATLNELDALTQQVAQNESTEQSAILLINGIAARIAAAGVDPAKLNALTSGLKQTADALAAAVVANSQPGPVTGS